MSESNHPRRETNNNNSSSTRFSTPPANFTSRPDSIPVVKQVWNLEEVLFILLKSVDLRFVLLWILIKKPLKPFQESCWNTFPRTQPQSYVFPELNYPPPFQVDCPVRDTNTYSGGGGKIGSFSGSALRYSPYALPTPVQQTPTPLTPALVYHQPGDKIPFNIKQICI